MGEDISSFDLESGLLVSRHTERNQPPAHRLRWPFEGRYCGAEDRQNLLLGEGIVHGEGSSVAEDVGEEVPLTAELVGPLNGVGDGWQHPAGGATILFAKYDVIRKYERDVLPGADRSLHSFIGGLRSPTERKRAIHRPRTLFESTAFRHQRSGGFCLLNQDLRGQRGRHFQHYC